MGKTKEIWFFFFSYIVFFFSNSIGNAKIVHNRGESMNIKALVCDLDGTLFPACQLAMVSDNVKKALIELQKKGIILILNTARIKHGCYPLAKYLEMDKYGGYIICCNGYPVLL